MNNYKIVISYLNFELRIMVFSMYDNNPEIIYEEKIYKGEITSISNDVDLDEIKKRLLKSYNEIEQNLKITKKNINLILDTTKNYISSQNIILNYESKHTIDLEDYKKIKELAFSKTIAKENLIYVDYFIEGYKIDDSSINFPLGEVVHKKLEVMGDLVYVDKKLYETLENIIKINDYRIINTTLSDICLKKNIDLIDNSGLIEIGSKNTKFIIKKNNTLKTFYTNIGLTNFFNNVYDILLEKYENKEEIEKAVRFLMQHFVFNPYENDYLVTENIYLNELVTIFQNVIINYFEYFDKELTKTNLNVNSFYILLNVFKSNEFIKLLQEKTNINCEMLIINDYRNLDVTEMKAALFIKMLYQYDRWEL